MILKADISKTSTGRYPFLFIFMCGNSKCTRIQKIKNFSGEVNWVHQALKKLFIHSTRNKLFPFLQYKIVKEKDQKAFVMFLQANRLFHTFDSRVLYQFLISQ